MKLMYRLPKKLGKFLGIPKKWYPFFYFLQNIKIRIETDTMSKHIGGVSIAVEFLLLLNALQIILIKIIK